MQSWKSQLRRGIVELCVLGVLDRDGESYGYQLLQALQGIEGLAFSESTVYPVLVRLAQQGLVTGRTEPSPNGPPRRFYHLTSEGQQRLEQLKSEWHAVCGSLNHLLEEGGKLK